MTWFRWQGTGSGPGVVLPPTTGTPPVTNPGTLPAAAQPLVSWGTADTFSTWTAADGGAITTGQADPWGGTSAALVSAAGYVKSATLTWGRSVEADVCVWLKQVGGATQTTVFELYDQSAGVNRVRCDVTWLGAAISSATAVVGTILAPVAVGDGWYLIRLQTSGLVAANTHYLAVTSGGATVRIAARPTVLLGTLDACLPWSQPRAGVARVVAPSGVEDGWTYGTDHFLRGTLRFLNQYASDGEDTRSGWFGGAGDVAWAGYGIDRMVADGLAGAELTLAPHRWCAASRRYTAWLAGESAEPALEGNGSKTVTLTFRSPTAAFYGVLP
jgi:hypothetical protein